MRRSNLQDDIQRSLAVAPDLRGLRVMDIARAVDRHSASVSRALKTLEARGRVVREGARFRVMAAGAAEVRETIVESLQGVTQELARWNEFRTRLEKDIELAVRGSAAATAQVREFAEMMARARQQWVSTLTPIFRAAEQLNASVRVWQEGLARTAEAIRSVFEGIRRWAVATREVHQALVPRGWLIPPQLLDVWPRLYRILSEKGVDAAEAALIEIVEEIASQPFEELYAHSAFAARRRLLEVAREAHLRKEYALSIPIFLAQADGIAIDVFGAELYKARGRRRVKEDHLPPEFDFSHTFWTVVADVMSRSVGLKRPVPSGMFTRHVVLHGRSLDYDTQENSAKAILLLCYLQFMVEEEEKARVQESAREKQSSGREK